MSDDTTWHDGDVEFPPDPLVNEAAHRPFDPDPIFGGTFADQRNDEES